MPDSKMIDTPAPWVDLDIMENNLKSMADYCAGHGINLRPHTKTHKIPQFAKKQLELGATGITCAKTGEAVIMAEAGIRDIFIAYPVWGEFKWQPLRELTGKVNLMLATDSAEHANALAGGLAEERKKTSLLVEVDFGFRRCGLQLDENLPAALVSIAAAGVPVRGLMFYPGHVKTDVDKSLADINAKIAFSIDAYKKAFGEAPEIVSGGSTPSAYYSHLMEGMTESRAGTYIFNDCSTVDVGACGWQDCAVKVRCRVVSTSVPGRAVLDGGSKTFSDAKRAGGEGFGAIVGYDDIFCEKMNEEHGYLDLENSKAKLEPGQLVDVVPNHVCTCINMHDTLYGMRGGEVVESWPIAARGKVQ